MTDNLYYKVVQTAVDDPLDQEISNRVSDLNDFFNGRDFENYIYSVEKLSDEEFLETETDFRGENL